MDCITNLYFNLALDALHITPIQGILQLRPSFDYINLAESGNNASRLDNSNSGIIKSDSEEEEELKPVTVRYNYYCKLITLYLRTVSIFLYFTNKALNNIDSIRSA